MKFKNLLFSTTIFHPLMPTLINSESVLTNNNDNPTNNNKHSYNDIYENYQNFDEENTNTNDLNIKAAYSDTNNNYQARRQLLNSLRAQRKRNYGSTRRRDSNEKDLAKIIQSLKKNNKQTSSKQKSTSSSNPHNNQNTYRRIDEISQLQLMAKNFNNYYKNIHLGSSHESDPCYDERRFPTYCEPDFMALASGRKVVTENSCQTNSQFCEVPQFDENKFYSDEINNNNNNKNNYNFYRYQRSLFNDISIRQCHVCESPSSSSNSQNSDTSVLLTDLKDSHNDKQSSCWRSEPVIDSNHSKKNITLELPLNKLYEVHYVSLEFCTPTPKNMVISKSVDYGRSWEVLHYYSDSCRATFGIDARDPIFGGCFDIYFLS